MTNKKRYTVGKLFRFSSTYFNSYNTLSYSIGSPKRKNGKFVASENYGLGLTIKEIPFVQETKVLMVASENGEIHDNLEEYKLCARDELIIRVPTGLESEIHTIITTSIYEKWKKR